MACKFGNIKIVQLLLAHQNVDVNSVDNELQSPLHYACFNGHDEIIKILLDQPSIDKNLEDVLNCFILI